MGQLYSRQQVLGGSSTKGITVYEFTCLSTIYMVSDGNLLLLAVILSAQRLYSFGGVVYIHLDIDSVLAEAELSSM